jgi:hypothetical protein
MVQRNPSGKDRRERVVIFLWTGAATIFVAGAALRVIASLFTRGDLRVTGVLLMAVAPLIGGIGWIGERYLLRRAP